MPYDADVDKETWTSLTGVVPGLDCDAISPPPATSASPASTKVPRHLHFVWIGGRPLPVKYCINLATFVNCLAADRYTMSIWMDTPPPSCLPPEVVVRNATAFLAANKALDTALAARPNVGYKADLFRYALIASHGGVYMDLDSVCARSPAEAWREPFVAWTGAPHWDIQNSVFGFPKHHSVISAVVACALEYSPKTDNPSIPVVTGPQFFTTAVKQQALKVSGKVASRAVLGGGLPRVRLLPQAFFSYKEPKDGVAPYTVQTYDNTWVP